MVTSWRGFSSLWLGLALAVGCGGSASLLAPQCVSPAPLLGQFNPAAPGYIVLFHDQVNAVAETQRLAATYAFTPKYVYESALKGFAAELAPSVVAALRCEPSVASMEYNQVVTLAG
jgi:hypothetical protein